MKKTERMEGAQEMRSAMPKKLQAGQNLVVSTPVPDPVEIGHIDFYGYLEGVAGWFFIGWTHRPKQASDDCIALARFDRSGVGGKATIVYFRRPDLVDPLGLAVGVVVFVEGTGRVIGDLSEIRLQFGNEAYLARSVISTRRLDGLDLLTQIRTILIESAAADANRLLMLRMLSRPIFRGEDTVASLPIPVYFALDEIIVCPPMGLLLIGWRLGGRHAGYSLRLRSGRLGTEFVPELGYRVGRPDVVEGLGRERGFVDIDCGFMILLPHAHAVGESTFLEIETAAGAIAYKPLAISHRSGMEAIKHILAIVAPHRGEFDASFDNVIGPAISALNRVRLRTPLDVAQIAFGPIKDEPTHTLIVPLYGRVDFMEYQMAQFCRDPAAHDLEIIYVLDDPPRRRELENLAQSVYERYEIPIRLLLLSRNVGYAPANNIGLKAARGKFVCFLNSDVFPSTPDWLYLLTDQLKRHPEIGAIGPRLLYEDGSVQHEGCTYEEMPEFDGWSFVRHHNKGRRPATARALRQCEAITGACIVLERSLALGLGGFDESYITGDFEDSDLCMKIRKSGRECAVDLDIALFHLERKSQTSPDQTWRQNLTLYNAWVHQRRWFEARRVSGQIANAVGR